MKYSIPEVNLPKLENEMKSLENKIKKYGGNFYYKVVGQHFEDVELYGEMKKVLFFEVEVEGELKFNDWEYCASIENTAEGNIIVSKDGGHEIPEEYYYNAPKCDHCGSNRYRRYTYIIRNDKSGEYKQVGKACLEDYTKGLSASAIAQLAEFFKNIQKISKDRSNDIYYENTEKLLISLQAYLDRAHIKYVREIEIPEDYDGSREVRAYYNSGYYHYKPCKITWTPKKVNCGYTPKEFYDAFINNAINIKDENLETYKNRFNKAKAWYAEQADDKGNEFHNYKTLIAQEEVPFEDVGILCNGFVEYLISDDFIKEDLEKVTKIRDKWLEEDAERKVQEDINLLKTVEELKSYNKGENLEGKYANITIVKKIEVGHGDRYYVDSNNNVYDLGYHVPENVDTTKNFVIRNIYISCKKPKYCYYMFNNHELGKDIEFEYYTIDPVRENEYNSWSKSLITAENTEEIVNEIYNTRAELLGEPEKLNEYIGSVNEVITVELKNGLEKITTSPKGVILYEGLDDMGRTLGIWSKKELDYVKKPVKVTGKIWRHNSYYSKKSTLINLSNYELI